MKKPLLLIDTATEKGIVSLFDESKCLVHCDLPDGLNNSRYLLPEIHKGLERLHLHPKDLQAIVCGAGPGSYTGMRVGAMTAKTLSFALEIPLVGVCTLLGFVPPVDGKFAALIDAKIAGAYCLIGERKGDDITYAADPKVMKLEELAPLLAETEHLVTPKQRRLQEKLESLAPQSAWQWHEIWPSAKRMERFARTKWEKGEFTLDGTLELLYLNP